MTNRNPILSRDQRERCSSLDVYRSPNWLRRSTNFSQIAPFGPGVAGLGSGLLTVLLDFNRSAAVP